MGQEHHINCPARHLLGPLRHHRRSRPGWPRAWMARMASSKSSSSLTSRFAARRDSQSSGKQPDELVLTVNERHDSHQDPDLYAFVLGRKAGIMPWNSATGKNRKLGRIKADVVLGRARFHGPSSLLLNTHLAACLDLRETQRWHRRLSSVECDTNGKGSCLCPRWPIPAGPACPPSSPLRSTACIAPAAQRLFTAALRRAEGKPAP